MTANVNPRYTLSGDPSSNNGTGMAPTILTADNDYTGVGSHYALVFTAGTNGARIAGLRFKAAGGTTSATVARIFTNNGSSAGTATNNSFIGELSLPVVTASASAGTVDMDYIFPGGYLDLPANFRIYVGLGTTVTNGWVVTPIQGGQF